jgi:hypothetical protein
VDHGFRRLALVVAACALACSSDGITPSVDPRDPIESGSASDSVVLNVDTVQVEGGDYTFVSARTVSSTTSTALTWQIADPATAIYSRINETLVSVWGRKAGKTTLTVTRGSFARTIPVVVAPEVVADLYVYPRVVAVAAGIPASIDAYIRNARGSNGGTSPVTWSPGDPELFSAAGTSTNWGHAVGTVSTLSGTGTTNLTVQAGNRTAAVTVYAATPYRTLTLGRYHACALKQDGTPYCWGSNDSREFGVDLPGSHLPRPVALPQQFLSLAASYRGTCGLSITEELYCWGSILAERQPVTRVPVPEKLKQISVGTAHVCALGNSGKIYCAGTGYAAGASLSGRSDGSSAIPAAVTFKAVAAGAFHTCAIGSDDRTYCWGRDDMGQLGDSVPERNWAAGRPNAQPVVGSHRFVKIFGGPAGGHTCGLTEDGTAFCWGEYIEDPAGPTTTDCRDGFRSPDRCTPLPIPMTLPAPLVFITTEWGDGCGLEADGSLVCWGRTPEVSIAQGGSRRQPQRAPGSLRYTTVALYFDLACGLSTSGLAFCWGANSHRAGQAFQDQIVPAPAHVYGPSRLLQPTLVVSP